MEMNENEVKNSNFYKKMNNIAVKIKKWNVFQKMRPEMKKLVMIQFKMKKTQSKNIAFFQKAQNA